MQVRPLRKATQLSNRNIIIIMAVMMLIVLSIVLANVAFVQNEEPPEDDFDDFLAIGGWVASWTIIFTALSLALNLGLEFLILVVFAEYLRSHIGEKRFGISTSELNNSLLITDSRMTALLRLRAVISFSVLRFYQIHMRKLTSVLFPVSGIHSTLLGKIISIQGGTLP